MKKDERKMTETVNIILFRREEHKYYLIIYTLTISWNRQCIPKKLQRAAKGRQHHMSRNEYGGANAS